MNYKDIPPKINKENLTGEAAVMSSMKNILSTSIGSVPGHPEFGCGINKFLFEQLDYLNIHMIKEEIKYALKRWEPRINIQDIEVKEDLDYNRVNIKIKFNIINEPDNPEREFIYSTNI